jgi:hypothetical protein
VGGIDYSAWQETDWDSDVSVKVGLELNPQASRRTIRLLLEYYRGHLPYGQFFEIEGESFGIGFTLNF